MGLHYPFEELSACGRVVDRMTAIFTTSIPVLAANNGKGNRYQDDSFHTANDDTKLKKIEVRVS